MFNFLLLRILARRFIGDSGLLRIRDLVLLHDLPGLSYKSQLVTCRIRSKFPVDKW